MAGNFDHMIQVDPAKNNALIVWSGTQSEIDFFTGMQPNARGADDIAQCPLSNHVHPKNKSAASLT